MINRPLISIALATYNGEKYLEDQLNSIYTQTYKNIEVAVTDDCSTDKTVEILEQYSKSHGLKYFVNTENLGFVKNFEKAISLCEGDFIALSDQDDVWEKDEIGILVNKIGSKLFKKDLLKNTLPFPDGLAYEGWGVATCAATENKITYTHKSLIKYRQHSEQETGICMQKKVSIFSNIYSRILNRWNEVDFERIVASRKQLQNLQALKNNSNFFNQSEVPLEDVILYFEDYLNNKVHIRTFLLGMKYHKALYPHKNYLFLKNILWDIVG